MKLTTMPVIYKENKPIFQLMVGEGSTQRVADVPLITSPSDMETQTREPVQLTLLGSNLWLYRNKVVFVRDAELIAQEEVVLRIKHKVLSELREFDKLKRQVEAFERFEKISKTPREPIPDEVRMFVWQRDQGCCAQCGSQERLEYDHIIPLALGGANTERNIQLLCENCNRTKGPNVT